MAESHGGLVQVLRYYVTQGKNNTYESPGFAVSYHGGHLESKNTHPGIWVVKFE